MMSLCRLKDLTLIGTGVTMLAISHLLHRRGEKYVGSIMLSIYIIIIILIIQSLDMIN